MQGFLRRISATLQKPVKYIERQGKAMNLSLSAVLFYLYVFCHDHTGLLFAGLNASFVKPALHFFVRDTTRDFIEGVAPALSSVHSNTVNNFHKCFVCYVFHRFVVVL